MIYPFKNKFGRLFEVLKTSNIEIIFNNFERGFSNPRKNESFIDRVYTMNRNEDNFFYPEKYKEVTALLPSELRIDWVAEKLKYPLQGIVNLFNFRSAIYGIFEKAERGEKTGIGRLLFTDDPVSPGFVNYGAAAWDMVPEANKPFWEKGRYFHADSQGGLYTAIIQEVNHEKKHFDFDFDMLWLLYEDGANFEAYPLALELDEYMDMLCLTKGCAYWQLLFIENAGEEVGPYEVSYILKMLIGLPELSPEEDYSPLFKQFEKEFITRAENSAKQHDVENIGKLLKDYYVVRAQYIK